MEINSVCLYYYFTWKRGFLFSISAKIVPSDHTSKGQEYLGQPSRTSGALMIRVRMKSTTSYESASYKLR